MAGPAAEDQSGVLEEAFGFVAEQRFYLRKAIQHNDLEMALRYGLCLTNELRSSQLLAENYYKLYALVFWELQHLAAFVASTERHGLDVAEVYELVQYEGNVLPRLYMLVTVGVVYMQSSPAPALDVLEDLGSMLTAVQHPVRGLFLRYYLLQMVKDRLPTLRGTRGALQYLLSNLRESVSLWARLRLEDGGRAAGAAGSGLAASEAQAVEAWRLDRGRHALRLLVGAHVLHLARLSALTVELHSEVVLPEMLRLSTTCEDAAGQAYLLQCFVEVFPDRFHLETLESVLAACAQVHWAVDLRPLLQHLLRRLTVCAQQQRTEAGASRSEVDAFGLFHSHLRRLHARPRSPATPLASLLELQLELAAAVLALHPGDASRVELVLHGTVELLGQSSPVTLDVRSTEAIVDVLAAPLTQEPLVPAVLAMPHHARLMSLLGRAAQREAALAMVSALLAGDVAISDCDTLRRLLVLVDRLIRDEGGSAQGGHEATSLADAQRYLEHDAVAFTDEQNRVARLVHQVRHADPDVAFQMLCLLHGHFEQGGPHRAMFTLPAMVVATLRLVWPLLPRQLKGALDGDGAGATGHSKAKVEELFRFSFSMCTSLSSLAPEEGLRLWLLCASAAERASRSAGENGAVFGGTCGRFVESALACLEDKVSGPEAQFRGLQLFVGTLCQVTCLEAKRYELVAERVVRFGGRLPTKRLQSRALCCCSSLFWGQALRDPGRTLVCLRRALKDADGAVHVDPTDVGLFVEVLDQAVHYFSEGNQEITAPFLSRLLELCSQHLEYEPRAPAGALRALRASLAELRQEQAEALEAARPAGLELRVGLPGAGAPAAAGA